LLQAGAEKAVPATDAIFHQETVTAILAVGKVRAVIALRGRDSFVATLARKDRQTINAVFAGDYEFSVQTILRIADAEHQVTVPHVQRIVRVCAVFNIDSTERRMRYRLIELMELFDE
jgi:hypothetical protein